MHISKAAYIIGSLGGRPSKKPKSGYYGGGYFPYTFDSVIITFDSITITFDHQ